MGADGAVCLTSRAVLFLNRAWLSLCCSVDPSAPYRPYEKAELYLLRTDGYTSQRANITNSLLTITHPSTNQHMVRKDAQLSRRVP